MPLMKNGEFYKLTEQDKEAVRRTLNHKFPAVFKMPEEWTKPDPDNKGRFKRPPGVNIPTTCIITEEDGFNTWAWGRTFVNKLGKTPLDGQIPFDRMFSFEKEARVGENQMDLLFYLLFKCPLLKGSPLAPPHGKAHFYLEDKEAQSLTKNEFRKVRAAVEHYISSEYSATKVRKFAAAFDIIGVLSMDRHGKFSMGEQEVRDQLLSLLERLGEKGYREFDSRSKLLDEVDIRAYMRYMEDAGLLAFDPKIGWVLMKDNKVYKELTNTFQQKDPQTCLIIYLKKNPNELEVFKGFAQVDWDAMPEESPKFTPKPKGFQKKKEEEPVA